MWVRATGCKGMLWHALQVSPSPSEKHRNARVGRIPSVIGPKNGSCGFFYFSRSNTMRLPSSPTTSQFESEPYPPFEHQNPRRSCSTIFCHRGDVLVLTWLYCIVLGTNLDLVNYLTGGRATVTWETCNPRLTICVGFKTGPCSSITKSLVPMICI